MLSPEERSRIAQLLGCTAASPARYSGIGSLYERLQWVDNMPIEVALIQSLLQKIEAEEIKLDEHADYVHIKSAEQNEVIFQHGFGIAMKERKINRLISQLATTLGVEVGSSYLNASQSYQYQ